MIRKWGKLERFVDGQLQTTKIFDDRERLYDPDELRAAVQQAGFHTIEMTQAYTHASEPQTTDGCVISRQK